MGFVSSSFGSDGASAQEAVLPNLIKPTQQFILLITNAVSLWKKKNDQKTLAAFSQLKKSQREVQDKERG